MSEKDIEGWKSHCGKRQRDKPKETEKNHWPEPTAQLKLLYKVITLGERRLYNFSSSPHKAEAGFCQVVHTKVHRCSVVTK